MDNIIRRSFVANRNHIDTKKSTIKVNFCPYGVVGGQVVGIHKCDGEGGSHLEILIRSLDGDDHIVGTFDNTPEGQMHAEITAMSILRSLRVVI